MARQQKRNFSKILLVTSAVLALLSPLTKALENGLGKTPPMGWNTWNKYACLID